MRWLAIVQACANRLVSIQRFRIAIFAIYFHLDIPVFKLLNEHVFPRLNLNRELVKDYYALAAPYQYRLCLYVSRDSLFSLQWLSLID